MKFSTDVLYEELSRKLKFHDIQYSDIHTVAKGINEFLPIISMFLHRFGSDYIQNMFT
jgi:hypothetical protein